MRPIRKITAACLAIAVAAGLGLAADAGAKKSKKKHVASHITLQAAGADGISGRVKAKGKACRSQRQVTLYRVNSGPSVPSSDVVTTTWTQGKKGKWSLPSPQSPGQYWAQVKKKTLPKNKKRGRAVICRAASSNVLTWG